MRLRMLIVGVLLACFMATGCASTLKITSDPPGAMVRVRGSGRPSYQWTSVGVTPCEIETPYSAVYAYVLWKDGTESEKVRVPLSNWEEPAPLVFRKK